MSEPMELTRRQALGGSLVAVGLLAIEVWRDLKHGDRDDSSDREWMSVVSALNDRLRACEGR